jgi:hypothetical protein
MALQEFKITYRDRSTQTVTAAEHQAEGSDWIVFSDGLGQVLRVPAKDVLSIGRSDLADRETPAPHIA